MASACGLEALRTVILKMPNLKKIEAQINDEFYKNLLESTESFNSKLCLERKMRLPFLDPQTGIAQRNSNLYMKKSQVKNLVKIV